LYGNMSNGVDVTVHFMLVFTWAVFSFRRDVSDELFYNSLQVFVLRFKCPVPILRHCDGENE
jgi:hypothetical protein